MVAVTVGETAGVGASVVPRFGCGLGGVKPVASSSWGARRLSRWARSPRRAVAAASSEMSMETTTAEPASNQPAWALPSWIQETTTAPAVPGMGWLVAPRRVVRVWSTGVSGSL